jgi:hypothetical protein
LEAIIGRHRIGGIDKRGADAMLLFILRSFVRIADSLLTTSLLFAGWVKLGADCGFGMSRHDAFTVT